MSRNGFFSLKISFNFLFKFESSTLKTCPLDFSRSFICFSRWFSSIRVLRPPLNCASSFLTCTKNKRIKLSSRIKLQGDIAQQTTRCHTARSISGSDEGILWLSPPSFGTLTFLKLKFNSDNLLLISLHRSLISFSSSSRGFSFSRTSFFSACNKPI